MFINPDLATQLAREHHDQLLAQASRRQLRPRPDRPASRTPSATGIGRRLAAAIARAGVVAAQAPNAIWPGGSFISARQGRTASTPSRRPCS